MNGRTAKMIRKAVYEDQSLKQERKYVVHKKNRNIKVTGLRAEYQATKQAYKILKREGKLYKNPQGWRIGRYKIQH